MSRHVLAAILALLVTCLGVEVRADDEVFASGIEALKSGSFQDKQQAVAQIGESESKAARPALMALLEGRLYVIEANGRVVIAREIGTKLALTDAVTGVSLPEAEPSELEKIRINNSMRNDLRTILARLSLRADSASERIAAVKSLFGSLTQETVALLRDSLLEENDARVQRTLRVALALAELESAEPARRLSAVQVLAGNAHSEVRNRLAEMLGSDDDGNPKEEDAEVRRAAARALAGIDQRRELYVAIETVFFGLSLGFVLVLAATGLAITFGVMGVINMAHGELMMLGAYSTWVVQQAMPGNLELSLLVAVPVAFFVSALVGIAIERGVVRFLYGRPLETLLATFGISLILQQAVRTIFSPLNRAVATPEWMSGQLIVNDALGFTYNRLYIIVFSTSVFLLLVFILRFTKLGLQIRAVSQNRDMARAMGVRGAWIDAATFGLGSGVAGLAGVALSQLTNVGPNLGQSHIVDSFMVVVFGGVGNLWGTLVAGLTLGVANKFLEPFAGSVLAKILVLVFIILFIQRRPRGLIPQRGRAAEG